jgi:DNA-directed RNA polymerase subunit M/transcription elongation factor TFIIS
MLQKDAVKSMPLTPRYLQLVCRDCGAVSLCGPTEILARLRAAGMLRREKEPSWELISELLPKARDRFLCAQCGAANVTVTPLEDEFDDEPGTAGRACIDCGQRIPVERLALFPEMTRCARCQQRRESGQDAETPEFCPRCGAVMVPRMCSGQGITRYAMRCPDCGGR